MRDPKCTTAIPGAVHELWSRVTGDWCVAPSQPMFAQLLVPPPHACICDPRPPHPLDQRLERQPPHPLLEQPLSLPTLLLDQRSPPVLDFKGHGRTCSALYKLPGHTYLPAVS